MATQYVMHGTLNVSPYSDVSWSVYGAADTTGASSGYFGQLTNIYVDYTIVDDVPYPGTVVLPAGPEGPPGEDGAPGPAGPGLSSRNIQYVAAPTDGGNDANDGKTWATAKATVHAAWMALGPSSFGTGGDIYVHDGASWNSDTTVGLWVTRDLTGLDASKWLPEYNVYIHGAAKARSVAISRQPQAMVLGGSTTDREKPGVWIGQCGIAITLENIALQNNLARPILVGTRGGASSTYRSDYSSSFVQFINVSAFCQQGADYGPCVDVGFAFWNNFIRCTFSANHNVAAPTGTTITDCVYAIPWNIDVTQPVPSNPPSVRQGSPTFYDISEPPYTLTAGQRVLLCGQTTLSQNGTYTWNSGAAMTKVGDDPVGSVVNITALPTGGGRYAGTQFVKRTDLHYEWMQTVADRRAGICFQGGDGWTFSADDMNMVYAGIRMNTPLASFRGQINWLTGEGPIGELAAPIVQLIGSSHSGTVLCTNVVVADMTVTHEVWVDPRIPPAVVTCMQVDKVYNATVMGGRYYPDTVTASVSPYTDLAAGFVNGKVFGQVDHARRLFGGVPILALNRAKTDPTTWGIYTTAGQTAPDGSTDAGLITGASSFAQVFRNNLTLTVGDRIVAGVWCKRGALSTDSPFGTVQCLTSGFTFASGSGTQRFLPVISGDGEWQWLVMVCVVAAIGTNPCDTLFNISASASVPATFYGPVFLHLPLASYTANEANEIAASLNSYPLNAPVGTVSYMPGQTLRLPGRLVSQGKLPTIASGAGVTATLSASSNETAGTVNVTVAGAPTAAGAVVATVTFASALAVAPRVFLTPKNAVSAAGACFSASTTTTFTVSTANALAAAAVTSWDYWVAQ